MKSQDLESNKYKYNTGNWLYIYAKNIFSQFGKDGIIEKYFPFCLIVVNSVSRLAHGTVSI
ncbi:hypothetical protein ACFL03_00885 [Thermodesulfobacteriota bacterium]